MLQRILLQTPDCYPLIELDDIQYRLNKINKAIILNKESEIIADLVFDFYFRLFTDLFRGSLEVNLIHEDNKKFLQKTLLTKYDSIKTYARQIEDWYEYAEMEYPTNLVRLVYNPTT